MSGIVRANNAGQSGLVSNIETIDSDDYVDASIDNAHLADDAVDTDELADDAVDADRLAANAVVNASVASGAAINFSKMEDLTASRALVSDGSGDVSVSAVTSTEVGYLDGVTSAIQTQIDAGSAPHMEAKTGTLSVGTAGVSWATSFNATPVIATAHQNANSVARCTGGSVSTSGATIRGDQNGQTVGAIAILGT